MELLDLQALLEAERVSQTNPEKRGNSIFSEVEDRRQQVERHLTKLTSLLDKERRKNQDLQAEVVKVKVACLVVLHSSLCFTKLITKMDLFSAFHFFILQNQMAFLACGGGNSEPSRSSEQMENLLRTCNAQNKVGYDP